MSLFTRDGLPLQPGQILYQRDLARTLQAIIDGGRDAFYRGPIAEALMNFSQEQGGLLSMKDLADCHARWQVVGYGKAVIGQVQRRGEHFRQR